MSESTANHPPASRRRRLAATVFDAVITAALVLFLTLASGQFEEPAPYLEGTVFVRAALLVIAGYLLLHGFTLYRSAQTLGKKLFGLQIVASDQPAPFWRLMLRAGALLSLAFIPVIGYWLQAVHLVDAAMLLVPDKRTLHDRLSGTRVIALTRNDTRSRTP